MLNQVKVLLNDSFQNKSHFKLRATPKKKNFHELTTFKITSPQIELQVTLQLVILEKHA